MSWAVFAAYLQLGAKEDTEARAILRRLKEAVARLFPRPQRAGASRP